MNKSERWTRYRRHLCDCPQIGLRLDISRMAFPGSYLDSMSGPMRDALSALHRLESGEKANVDEDRMVGHYWLRNPGLAPAPQIASGIGECLSAIRGFVDAVHEGSVRPQRADAFDVVLLVGIGGSALGPQLLADALGGPDDPMLFRLLDNTDPDGIRRTLMELDDYLERTLTVVVSKSGSTIETRNGMVEVAAAYRRAGLNFARHAVAVTETGSTLHDRAVREEWLSTFPIWNWVGGRTSISSAVGLLPAALLGFDVDAFLAGARECDQAGRIPDPRRNPAALLALMWHFAGGGQGSRRMVVLPYRDRLQTLGRYLQQLVMESIGKRLDRAGRTVHQGLTVLGNKGSTDQHSIVQQLVDGTNDFFVTFVEVLNDGSTEGVDVDADVTTGDCLSGFLFGTREALTRNDRESLTITLDEWNARSLGAILALFERAVGLYAELINVNAYHQPGVEEGKKAAVRMLDLQRRLLERTRSQPGEWSTADEWAARIGEADVESVYFILEHLAAQGNRGLTRQPVDPPFNSRFGTGSPG